MPEINVQPMDDVGRQLNAAAQMLTMKPALEGDRLTGQYRIYHESPGEETTAISCNYTRMLKTSEQTFRRKITVGESWQELDTGWFKPEDIGLIIIENRVGAHQVVVPSEEEVAKLEAQILEISLRGDEVDDILVRPREAIPLDLARKPNLKIRSRSGSFRIILTIIGK